MVHSEIAQNRSAGAGTANIYKPIVTRKFCNCGVSTCEGTPPVRRETHPRGVDTTRPASLTTNKIVNFWSLPPGTQNAPDAEVPLYPRRLHAALVSDSK